MEAYAQDVINRYELGKKGLDIEEQKLVKDIVLGMLEIASKGAGAALGAKVGKTGFTLGFLGQIICTFKALFSLFSFVGLARTNSDILSQILVLSLFFRLPYLLS